MDFNPGDKVTIFTASDLTRTDAPRDTPLTGTVKRMWGTRARNVTVITDDGRTFVRLAVHVTKI